MKTTIRIIYYGMDGQGATVKDAKEDAGRKLKAAMDRLQRGIMVRSLRDRIAVIFPTLDGWAYRFADSPCVHSGWDAADEAERACRRHAAQNASNPVGAGDTPDDALELIENTQDRKDHLTWCDWQRRYAEARATGATDPEAHALASIGG